MGVRGMVLIPRLRGIGGMETVIQTWIDHYHAEPDVDLFFLAPQGMENQERFSRQNDSLKIAPLIKPHALGKVVGAIITLNELIRRKPEFVICTSIPLLKLAERFRRILPNKFKIVSWLHFSVNSLSIDDNNLLSQADMHLAISSGIKRQLVDRGIGDDQIKVIFNPAKVQDVETSLIDTYSHTPLKLLYVGRIIWSGQKNLQLLLTSLTRLHFNWSLQIFGAGDEADISILNDFVKQHGLADKVELRGWSKSPFSDAAPSDYLILTSRYEGFPMVLIESASRGLPIISSDCPTGPEDIVTDMNGLLFTNDDQDSLIESLEKARSRRGTFSPKLVHESVDKFSEKEYFIELDGIIKSL